MQGYTDKDKYEMNFSYKMAAYLVAKKEENISVTLLITIEIRFEQKCDCQRFS